MASTLDLSPQYIRISESNSSISWSKFILSFLGLIGVGLGVALFGGEDLLNIENGGLMSLFLSLAVLGFGTSSLLSWRQKSETQEIRIAQGIVEVRSSLLRKPLFHSSIDTTKVQRFRLQDGREQIFLRNNEKALEVGQTLGQEDQKSLAKHLETVLGEHAPLGFSRRTV